VKDKYPFEGIRVGGSATDTTQNLMEVV
jgi:hypothetical protein